MAYTDLEVIRLNLADPYQLAFDENAGDGSTVKFRLSHKKVRDDSLVIAVDDLSTTDYTFDDGLGIVTFDNPPESDTTISMEYEYSAFSDEELEEFLDVEGSIDGAVLRCIEILLVDSARRFDYSAGRSELKPSQVFSNLKELREIYKEKVKEGDDYGGVRLGERVHTLYEDEEEIPYDLSRLDYE